MGLGNEENSEQQDGVPPPDDLEGALAVLSVLGRSVRSVNGQLYRADQRINLVISETPLYAGYFALSKEASFDECAVLGKLTERLQEIGARKFGVDTDDIFPLFVDRTSASHAQHRHGKILPTLLPYTTSPYQALYDGVHDYLAELWKNSSDTFLLMTVIDQPCLISYDFFSFSQSKEFPGLWRFQPEDSPQQLAMPTWREIPRSDIGLYIDEVYLVPLAQAREKGDFESVVHNQRHLELFGVDAPFASDIEEIVRMHDAPLDKIPRRRDLNRLLKSILQQHVEP